MSGFVIFPWLCVAGVAAVSFVAMLVVLSERNDERRMAAVWRAEYEALRKRMDAVRELSDRREGVG